MVLLFSGSTRSAVGSSGTFKIMDENILSEDAKDTQEEVVDEEEEFDPASIRWENGVVLFLGDMPKESATTAAKTTGRDYVTKIFRSSSTNWEAIENLVKKTGSNPRTQIVCIVSEDTIWKACLPEYSQIFERILVALAHTRHIIFIYHKVLLGQLNWLDDQSLTWRVKSYHYPDGLEGAKAAINLAVSRLNRDDLRIAPYRKRVELNASIAAFLTEEFTGLIFRLYIPNDRLWGAELDKLLKLFRDYLLKVAGVQVTLNQNHTEHGISYNFYSKDTHLTGDNFAGVLQEFNSFLDVCAHNPAKAADVLRVANVPEVNVQDIVTRYSRDSRRLILDIEYARKSAMDQIQYRLMSELLDIESQEQSHLLSGTIAGNSLPTPQPLNILSNLMSSTARAAVSIQQINIENVQIIGTAKGIIASTIQGDVHYSESDERLIELICQFAAGTDTIQLTSALDELKDSSTRPVDRLTAWQRLQAFLSRHADKIEQVAVKTLATYLESLLKPK